MNIRQMERLAYDLDRDREQERKRDADEEKRLEELGIVNRRAAHRAGVHTRRMRDRKMTVPK